MKGKNNQEETYFLGKAQETRYTKSHIYKKVFDGSVGGAGAAAVGMIGHEEIPPCKIRAKRTFGPRAEDSLRRGAKNIHRARTL